MEAPFVSLKSINATVSLPTSVSATLSRMETEPVPHFVSRHMSESLSSTWPSDVSAFPWAEAFCTASVLQSERPVTRVYLEPAIQPLTSRLEPMTTHTLAVLLDDFAVTVTFLSTSGSTPGSVTT